jgi:hypothetical protein
MQGFDVVNTYDAFPCFALQRSSGARESAHRNICGGGFDGQGPFPAQSAIASTP